MSANETSVKMTRHVLTLYPGTIASAPKVGRVTLVMNYLRTLTLNMEKSHSRSVCVPNGFQITNIRLKSSFFISIVNTGCVVNVRGYRDDFPSGKKLNIDSSPWISF